MPVPKRRMSRSNTRHRRSAWVANNTQLVKTVVNGKTVYSLPHRARAVEDSNGDVQFYEYKGRKVADA
ncbi:MAG: 50S ribosomal protein L32 [Micrococcales bacterium]|jgi:large subunit ribosomal protein L32|nr:50S ribosomal protein L32 [Micrococcales bacterium]NBR55116.1 50S ribosomal protein L32 [Micrococcales bacterium]NBR61393.1 50S ribosomal protein L32 [Actinomycetota bacterium]NBY44212.1 50S ribosomal protein L32 [Micrococcales bacterium]NDE88876.1 50S ribosomal protein L32 [Micrococcales bacterium]